MVKSLFEKTTEASVKIGRKTIGKGKLKVTLPVGCKTRNYVNHIDERGRLFELWNSESEWHDHPVKRVYCTTLRPKINKGWGFHERNEDRYCIIHGEAIVVLYDVRPGSETEGQFFQLTLSHSGPSQVNIPPGIWHSIRNPGETETFFLNLPTEPYDYDDPDKKNLPLDTPLIPWKF